METTFKYKIIDFEKLRTPHLAHKCDRLMIYVGTVVNNEGISTLTYWDKFGRCANEMYNDHFINPYHLIEYLNKELNIE